MNEHENDSNNSNEDIEKNINDVNTDNIESTDNIVNIESIENVESTTCIESISGTENGAEVAEVAEPVITPVYYTESVKKTKTRKSNVFHLILVSLLSSIFGAGVLFAALILTIPTILPAIGNYLDKTGQSSTLINDANKKVEIITTDSPVSAIAEKLSPSIVGIKVTMNLSGRSFFFNAGQEPSQGSGIIIREDGYILTNNHVIADALSGNSNLLANGAKIEIVLASQKEKLYEATVIGRDTVSDIAVLKIEAKGLPVAELGDSDNLKIGELAVTIGNPAGLEYMGSVTAGVISGLDRIIVTENGKELTLIQTDAAINPGNSGGALCNSKGQVIGVNTIKIAATGYEGLGFAIPINHVKSISQSLIDFKYVKGRPHLGIVIDISFTEDIAKQYNVPAGLLVSDVEPLSPAYKAGVKTGDIITKFDKKAVTVFKDLDDQKNTHKPGDNITIEVYRDEKTLTLTATLDETRNQ